MTTNTVSAQSSPAVRLVRSTIASLEKQLADGAYGYQREALVIALDVARKQLATLTGAR